MSLKKNKSMMKTIIIGEIGINYAYGTDQSRFLDNIKKLIDVASVAGVDYVKFQKRTPDLCVPLAERSKAKLVPWRKEETTYFQYKLDIELEKEVYREIDDYCTSKGMRWFASVWDKGAVDFMRGFETIMPNGKWGTMTKIPSALINDLELVEYARNSAEFLLISTGMSTQKEIDAAIQVGKPDVVFHTNSTYPAPNSELNLDYLVYLDHINRGNDFEKKFEVGYSGHEFGLTTTVAATLLGAKWIERHITLDRSLWGSDQMASVEPQGLIKLVKSIRDIEASRGGYGPREVLKSELEKRKTLRGK
jgi:N-acetylneuraminate synthase